VKLSKNSSASSRESRERSSNPSRRSAGERSCQASSSSSALSCLGSNKGLPPEIDGAVSATGESPDDPHFAGVSQALGAGSSPPRNLPISHPTESPPRHWRALRINFGPSKRLSHDDELRADPRPSRRNRVPARGPRQRPHPHVAAVLAPPVRVRGPGLHGQRRLHGSRQLGDRHRGGLALRVPAALGAPDVEPDGRAAPDALG